MSPGQLSLSERLRLARQRAGLSQQALADAIGISRDSVWNYENGRTIPKRPYLLSWALACGEDYDWLTGPEHSARPVRRRRTAATS